MSSLQPLISFRVAVDKLNDKEFKIFRNSWASLLDRDIISSMIFHHLQCVHSDKYNLPSIMNIITNIMNQRKKLKNNTNNIEEKQLKLSELPAALIGETASFLPQIDYAHFEVSCRQTYISCNNPSTLKYINLNTYALVEPCGLNWLNKYSLLQHISANTYELILSVCDYSRRPVFTHLEGLTLNGEHSGEQELKQLLQTNKLINPDNIKTLTCEKFENIHSDVDLNDLDAMNCMDISIFYKLLTYFPNIEMLALDQMNVSLDTSDDNKLATLLPNLRIFKVINNQLPWNGYKNVTNKIVNLFSDQLESLCIDYGTFGHPNINDLKFSKLKELKMPWTSIQAINDILNTSNILERLSIGVWGRFTRTQKMLIQLITRHKLLQSLEIGFEIKNWETIMKMLTNVLSETKNINRETFKLKLDVIGDKNQQIVISNYILDIASVLDQSHIQHFMLITMFRDAIPEQKSDTVLMELLVNDKFLSTSTHDHENQHNTFIVSNKNCNIGGYKTRWLCD